MGKEMGSNIGRLVILLFSCLILTACNNDEQSEEPKLILSANKVVVYSEDDSDIDLYTVDTNGQLEFTKDSPNSHTERIQLSEEDFKRFNGLISEVKNADIDKSDIDAGSQTTFWNFTVYDGNSNIVVHEKRISVNGNNCFTELEDFLDEMLEVMS